MAQVVAGDTASVIEVKDHEYNLTKNHPLINQLERGGGEIFFPYMPLIDDF